MLSAERMRSGFIREAEHQMHPQRIAIPMLAADCLALLTVRRR